MSKRAPKLQFTDEELAVPEVSKAAKKAAKRIEKLERLEAKIPMKNGTEKPRPASKLQHAVRDAPGKTVRSAVHREIQKSEDDNVGVESAHKLEEASEQTVRAAETAHRSHQLKPYRSADRAEARADSANLDALQKQHSSSARNCKAIHIPAGSRSAPSKRNMPRQRLAAARCVRPKSLPKPPSVPRRTRKKRLSGSRNTRKAF